METQLPRAVPSRPLGTPDRQEVPRPASPLGRREVSQSLRHLRRLRPRRRPPSRSRRQVRPFTAAHLCPVLRRPRLRTIRPLHPPRLHKRLDNRPLRNPPCKIPREVRHPQHQPQSRQQSPARQLHPQPRSLQPQHRAAAKASLSVWYWLPLLQPPDTLCLRDPRKALWW